jgi:uncharacterized protein YdhG (YjbR/CyaY superfamily)
MPGPRPKTIDEYLATVNERQRPLLEKLRKTVLAAAPGAEECISYGLAAFRLNKRPLVAFGAWVNHCAFYPMSALTLKSFASELSKFEMSKGTVRFTPEMPIPATLIRKMVKARIAENKERSAQARAET